MERMAVRWAMWFTRATVAIYGTETQEMDIQQGELLAKIGERRRRSGVEQGRTGKVPGGIEIWA